MAGRQFLVPWVTHRRKRRFTAKTNLFHTQYDTIFCSVFHIEHGEVVYKTFFYPYCYKIVYITIKELREVILCKKKTPLLIKNKKIIKWFFLATLILKT